MITDQLLRLSEDQAVTASAYSTNTIDLGQEDVVNPLASPPTKVTRTRDIGEGRELYMVFTVTETFATLTSLAFEIVQSANANLSSHTTLASTGAIATPATNLAAGKQFVLKIPPQIASQGVRYLGARYTVAGSNATAGKVTADIVLDIQDGKKFYDSGFTVA